MLCYHNIPFRNRAKKILIRWFPKMQCECKGLTLHLYSLSLYICCRLFLFSAVALCSFQAQLSDTLLWVNLYFHIHFRIHRPETSFPENRTKIQHHRSTKVNAIINRFLWTFATHFGMHRNSKWPSLNKTSAKLWPSETSSTLACRKAINLCRKQVFISTVQDLM